MNATGTKMRYTEAQLQWAVSMVRTGQAIVLPMDITIREYLSISISFLGLAAVHAVCKLLVRLRCAMGGPVRG